jgi:acyl transferase domain-containing protein
MLLASTSRHPRPEDKCSVLRVGDRIREELATQVQSTVRFVDEVNAMVDAGVGVFVEVGPGTVLSGLISRIAKDAIVISTDGAKALGTQLSFRPKPSVLLNWSTFVGSARTLARRKIEFAAL